MEVDETSNHSIANGQVNEKLKTSPEVIIGAMTNPLRSSTDDTENSSFSVVKVPSVLKVDENSKWFHEPGPTLFSRMNIVLKAAIEENTTEEDAGIGKFVKPKSDRNL